MLTRVGGRIGKKFGPPLIASPSYLSSHSRPISEWTLFAIASGAVLVSGWSPTPVKRNWNSEGETSGVVPDDAPPGYQPRPTHWQPGMPVHPWPGQVIPPAEGFRQWESWEATWKYMCAVLMGGFLYNYWVHRHKKAHEDMLYWMLRICTDQHMDVEELPMINPFEMLELSSVEESIWYDRYSMTFFANLFTKLKPSHQAAYIEKILEYNDDIEDVRARINYVLDSKEGMVDHKVLARGFVPMSNTFIDNLKLRIISEIDGKQHTSERNAAWYSAQIKMLTKDRPKISSAMQQ